MILDRSKELVNDYYTEPTDEKILGSFLATIFHDSPVQTQESLPFQRKEKKTVKFRSKRTRKVPATGLEPTTT